MPLARKPRPSVDERSELTAPAPLQIAAVEQAETYTVRARPRSERLISSTVRLPLWMMEELERLHAEEGLEKSTVVRAALEAYLHPGVVAQPRS